MTTNPWTEASNLREYKVCLLGDGGVGKSSLTVRFIQNHFLEDYDPTIEDWYRKQCVVDDEIALLDILDTAGQEDYIAMRGQYMRSSEGFLLVYSITSRQSFEQIIPLYQELLRVKGVVSCPVILVGNKCDLDHGRQVTAREARSCAERMGCMFIETSAKTHVRVDDAFYELVREIRAHNQMGSRTRQFSAAMAGLQTPNRAAEFAPVYERAHSAHCLSGCVVT
ncbi:24 kDa ras-like protein [Neolentinus lepideus HHB14362 ss-1]|uniref:24 kDa ras-like protein n=1 Tax=Neolentinus lepideus HHB14362 ss-1 TaxID=1314782 RepID=A0A165VGK3_9AGAM|nr:24 kDa ras-like protein [Neolentinus lepideus HHB14362 ss-1]